MANTKTVQQQAAKDVFDRFMDACSQAQAGRVHLVHHSRPNGATFEISRDQLCDVRCSIDDDEGRVYYYWSDGRGYDDEVGLLKFNTDPSGQVMVEPVLDQAITNDIELLRLFDQVTSGAYVKGVRDAISSIQQAWSL